MPQSDRAPGIAANTEHADGEVLEALRNHDRRTALALLMHKHGEAVRRFCADLVGDCSVADDLAQTTFVQAFEGLSQFAHRASFKAWLLGIARHRCLDLLKSERRWMKVVSTEENLPEITDESTPAADAQLSSRTIAAAIADCIQALPIAMREAVSLRYRQNLSYDEMATAIGERAGTLRVRVARALPLVRRCLQGKGVDP
jgi:RNA polymerase sigma factor (sigma-70 family)